MRFLAIEKIPSRRIICSGWRSKNNRLPAYCICSLPWFEHALHADNWKKTRAHRNYTNCASFQVPSRLMVSHLLIKRLSLNTNPIFRRLKPSKAKDTTVTTYSQDTAVWKRWQLRQSRHSRNNKCRNKTNQIYSIQCVCRVHVSVWLCMNGWMR